MGVFERIGQIAAYLATLFLSFFLGAFVTLQDLPPSDVMRQTVLLGSALVQLANPGQDGRWRKAHHPAGERGVIATYRPEQAEHGLNFVVSGNSPEAFLMTMAGEIVHRWRVPFGQVWRDPPHIGNTPTAAVYWPRAHLFPNGDILAVYHGYGDTPYGYGLARIDKDSNVIWRTAENIHHDIHVSGDGTIYTLTQEIQREDEPGLENLKAPFIAESILVLSPDGRPIRKIPIIDAFRKSPFAPLLHLMEPDALGDITHVNAIQLIERTPPPGHPFGAGQVLVSLRNVDTIAVVDLESGSVSWAMTGMWRRQHYPKLLDNGNVLIFDNQGHRGEGGASRVLELDPTTQRVVWSYAGDADNLFDSDRWGSQQRLANGNTLIVESTNGRAFEVTPAGEVVWDYRNPMRSGEHAEYVLVLPDLQRVDPESLTFLVDGGVDVAQQGSPKQGEK